MAGRKRDTVPELTNTDLLAFGWHRHRHDFNCGGDFMNGNLTWLMDVIAQLYTRGGWPEVCYQMGIEIEDVNNLVSAAATRLYGPTEIEVV